MFNKIRVSPGKNDGSDHDHALLFVNIKMDGVGKDGRVGDAYIFVTDSISSGHFL